MTSFPKEYYLAAASWWATHLPICRTTEITSDDLLALFEPTKGDEEWSQDLVNYFQRSIDQELSKTGDHSVEDALGLVAEFTVTLTDLIEKKAEERFDGTISFGSIIYPDAPELVKEALEVIGLQIDDLAFPSRTETIIHPQGIIEINMYNHTKLIYAGEGDAPTMIADAEISSNRIKQSPLVMIKNQNAMYLPVEKGDQIITAYTAWGQLNYRDVVADENGWLYASPYDMISKQAKPRDLKDNVDMFTGIDFCEMDDGHYLQDHFAAKAGDKIPLYYSKNGHADMPNNAGYTVNDGNNLWEFAGPYHLIEINEGERFMDRVDNIIIAEEGDFILYDQERGKMKLFTKQRMDFMGYEIVPIDQ